MTIWTDNAARFATTRESVDAQVDVVLANLEADLAIAHAPRRSWTTRDRIRSQRAAIAVASGPLERLSRASGRADVWTRDLSWPARRRGGAP